MGKNMRKIFFGFSFKALLYIVKALFFVQISASMAQQVCPPNLAAAAPNTRYTVLSNTAEIRDNATGLVWQRCSLGQTWSGTLCSGASASYSFNQALIAANGAASSGGNAWRLPNINELKSLTEWACHTPSLNEVIFPSSSIIAYWSSTSEQTISPVQSSNAWSYDFSPIAQNQMMPKSTTLAVRLVRFN